MTEARAQPQAEHSWFVRDGRDECTCGWSSPHVLGDPRGLGRWHVLAVGETIDNPYLQEFLAQIGDADVAALGSLGLDRGISSASLVCGSAYPSMEHVARSLRRDRLVAQYAWAIPTEGVVRRIARLSPLCELGCGTGYWARLLLDAGAEVIAVDASPPAGGENPWHRREAGIGRQPVQIRHFVDVIEGDALTFDVPSDHALFLCWPPHDDGMAWRALSRYRGSRVVYVGEGAGGCTGDDDFHAALDREWELTEVLEIPQWTGLHDAAHVYERRAIVAGALAR